VHFSADLLQHLPVRNWLIEFSSDRKRINVASDFIIQLSKMNSNISRIFGEGWEEEANI